MHQARSGKSVATVITLGTLALLAAVAPVAVAFAETVSLDAACHEAPAITEHGGRLHMVIVAANRTRELLHLTSNDGSTWTRKANLNGAAGGQPAVASFAGRLVCAFRANNLTGDVLLTVWAESTDEWTHTRIAGRNCSEGVALFEADGGLYLRYSQRTGRTFLVSRIATYDITQMVSQGADHGSAMPTRDGAMGGPPVITRHRDQYHMVFPAANEVRELLHWTSPDGIRDWNPKSELEEASQFSETHGLASYNGRLVCVFPARNESQALLLSWWDEDQNSWTHNRRLGTAGNSATLLVHSGRLLMYWTTKDDIKQIRVTDISGRAPPARRAEERAPTATPGRGSALVQGTPLKKLRGLSLADAKRLGASGIRTIEKLAKSDPAAIARKARLDRPTSQAAIAKAQKYLQTRALGPQPEPPDKPTSGTSLAKLRGLSAAVAKRLATGGIRTVEQLAKSDPAALARKAKLDRRTVQAAVNKARK